MVHLSEAQRYDIKQITTSHHIIRKGILKGKPTRHLSSPDLYGPENITNNFKSLWKRAVTSE